MANFVAPLITHTISFLSWELPGVWIFTRVTARTITLCEHSLTVMRHNGETLRFVLVTNVHVQTNSSLEKAVES